MGVVHDQGTNAKRSGLKAERNFEMVFERPEERESAEKCEWYMHLTPLR